MGTCPDSIKKLIDRFNHQSDQLRSPDYNETLIRIDYINPLMTELGWDIHNRQGYAEQYREVVTTKTIEVIYDAEHSLAAACLFAEELTAPHAKADLNESDEQIKVVQEATRRTAPGPARRSLVEARAACARGGMASGPRDFPKIFAFRGGQGEAFQCNAEQPHATSRAAKGANHQNKPARRRSDPAEQIHPARAAGAMRRNKPL